MRAVVAVLLGLMLLCGCRNLPVYAQPPQPGMILPCKVTEVVDGDTITVEIKLQVRVRLLDCWAAELKSSNAKEQSAGEESFRWMADNALDRSGVIMIPFSARNRLDDLFTFGRILADVHLSDDKTTLVSQSIQAGHSYATKEELQQALKQRE